MKDNSIQPIAYLHSPFKQKFAIPRQASSLSAAKGQIVFTKSEYAHLGCKGIDEFSHLWLLFIFHENIRDKQNLLVRPPRLGGNEKKGVYATRSSFRPNNIGMSLVKNEGLVNEVLHVSGVDLLHNTPIIDIKPYLPYADCQPQAAAGYANDPPKKSMGVIYTNKAKQQLGQYLDNYPDLDKLLENVLSYDPRPSYKQNKVDDKIYNISMYDLNIAWLVNKNKICVLSIAT